MDSRQNGLMRGGLVTCYRGLRAVSRKPRVVRGQLTKFGSQGMRKSSNVFVSIDVHKTIDMDMEVANSVALPCIAC
jgi:hypothetical protein